MILTYSTVNSPPCTRESCHQPNKDVERRREDDRRLTDSTLSSDVLPAFCSPSIVTSSSVALPVCVSRRIAHNGMADCLRQALERGALMQPWRMRAPAPGSTYQNVLSNQSYTFRNIPAMAVGYVCGLNAVLKDETPKSPSRRVGRA